MTSDRSLRSVEAFLLPLRELSLRRELLMVLLILAETMILYIVAGTLLAEREPPHAPPPIFLIFAVLLISWQIPHILATLRVWTPEYEIVMSIGLIALILLSIKVAAFPAEPLFSTDWLHGTVDALIFRESDSVRPVWLLILFVAYAWWRGRTRAEASLETGYSMLRYGLIWLAGILLITILAAEPGAAIFSRINVVLVGFLATTLLAIAIARQPESDTAPDYPWLIWVVIVALPVFAIAATAVSSVEVLTRDTLDLLITILTPLFWALGMLLRGFVLAVAVLAFVLMWPFIWLLERHGLSPLGNFSGINLSPATGSDADQASRIVFEIADPLRYVVAALVLVLLVWLLVRFTFARRKRWDAGSRQQRDSLIDWSQDPQSILSSALTWIRNTVRPRVTDPYLHDPEWRWTYQIRTLYRQFLRVSEMNALNRVPAETPSQFARRVAHADARLKLPADRITRQYNLARYSGRPATALEAQEVEQALGSFERILDGSS